jgi:hypothetical protein
MERVEHDVFSAFLPNGSISASDVVALMSPTLSAYSHGEACGDEKKKKENTDMALQVVYHAATLLRACPVTQYHLQGSCVKPETPFHCAGAQQASTGIDDCWRFKAPSLKAIEAELSISAASGASDDDDDVVVVKRHKFSSDLASDWNTQRRDCKRAIEVIRDANVREFKTRQWMCTGLPTHLTYSLSGGVPNDLSMKGFWGELTSMVIRSVKRMRFSGGGDMNFIVSEVAEWPQLSLVLPMVACLIAKGCNSAVHGSCWFNPLAIDGRIAQQLCRQIVRHAGELQSCDGCRMAVIVAEMESCGTAKSHCQIADWWVHFNAMLQAGSRRVDHGTLSWAATAIVTCVNMLALCERKPHVCYDDENEDVATEVMMSVVGYISAVSNALNANLASGAWNCWGDVVCKVQSICE